MENKQEKFQSLYENLHKKYYQKYEKMRKNSKQDLIITAISFVIAFFSIASYGEVHNNTFIIFFGIISGIVGMIFLKRGQNKKETYNKNYKQEVIKEFLKDINLNLEYNCIVEDQEKVNEEYKRAGFDNKFYNIWKYDDYISGQINDEIQFDIYDTFQEIEKQNKNGDRLRDIVFSRIICNDRNETK